jgi:hypothetical protein
MHDSAAGTDCCLQNAGRSINSGVLGVAGNRVVMAHDSDNIQWRSFLGAVASANAVRFYSPNRIASRVVARDKQMTQRYLSFTFILRKKGIKMGVEVCCYSNRDIATMILRASSAAARIGL